MKETKAEGRADAPFLFVMLSRPGEGMFGWFWRQLLKAGIKKTDCRIVYMIDEPPVNTGNKPSKAQLRSAKDRFELEVRRSSPSVAVPMGTEAFRALTGINESIMDARGYVIKKHLFHDVPFEVYKQVGTYVNASKATGAKKGDPKMKWVTESGPALLGRDFDGVVIPVFTLDHIRTEQFAVSPAFIEDIKRVRRAADDELQMLDMGKPITNEKKLPALKSWGDIIAIDIETHGIDNEVIDIVSFSDGIRTAVLQWTEGARAYVEKLFALPNRIFAIHNEPFDIPRLVLNGVTISQRVLDKQIFCTMFGASTLQPDLHKALGRVASLYLDIEPWKTSSRKDTHWRIMVHSDPIIYAGKDAFNTNWIARQEIAVMKDLGVWNLYTGSGDHPGPGVMATIPELSEMTRGGIRTNKKYAQKMCEQMEKRQFQYLKLWGRMFPDVKASANPQLIKLFYTAWGLPVYRTKEDGVSVDELTLVKLGAYVRDNKHDESIDLPWRQDKRCCPRTFELLLKIRLVSKMLSTYVQPVLLGAENWVHPGYLPVSKDDERGGKKMSSKGTTATGRLASFKPNIQNQPKKMRVLYVPDTDEMCFIQADYKSAELYVLAGMSGDQLLLDDLEHDMHQRNADRLGIERKIAKNVTYASQYLASPGKQSEMILEQAHIWVSPADCLNISDAIWGHYTNASAYKQLLVEMCEAKRYIQNPFGRIRFFHAGKAPAAVDFIPQSTVADILWCVLRDVAVFVRSLGGRLVTTVHDSILVCVPADKVEEAARGVKQIMERKFDCVRKGFFIPVDVEAGGPGASWGDLKKITV